MKVIHRGYNQLPDEIVRILITRKVRKETHGRGGYHQSQEYDEITITEASLNEVYDTVMSALKAKELA